MFREWRRKYRSADEGNTLHGATVWMRWGIVFPPLFHLQIYTHVLHPI